MGLLFRLSLPEPQKGFWGVWKGDYLQNSPPNAGGVNPGAGRRACERPLGFERRVQQLSGLGSFVVVGALREDGTGAGGCWQ